uniref:exodeoxyribonuclease III n=1 Tax=Fundulus heteroclitus TaxID=8078 RepID=A0A3Q2QFH5_FUNHE
EWVGQEYHSTLSSRKRGVSILIRKNIDCQIHKHVSHKEGRWVILDATLEGQRMTIANIYAPKAVDPNFFHEICNLIRDMGNNNIFIGGDFNQVRDLIMDKSSQSTQTNTVGVLALDVLSEELGLVVIWRLLHPTEKDFTFFSHPDSSYSRIDYFLISRDMVSQVLSSTIGNIVLSDHAPVDIVLHPLERAEKSMRWRFNNCMLNGEENCNFIKSEMQEFWKHNEGSIEDHGVMWDAFKSFLRGRIIQRSSFIKKIESQRLLKLETDIKLLEKQYSKRQDSNTWGKILEVFTIETLYSFKQTYSAQSDRNSGNFP